MVYFVNDKYQLYKDFLEGGVWDECVLYGGIGKCVHYVYKGKGGSNKAKKLLAYLMYGP